MKNSNTNNRSVKSFLKRNGFYIALVVCVVAAAAVSLGAVSRIIDNFNVADIKSETSEINADTQDDVRKEEVVPTEKDEEVLEVEPPVEEVESGVNAEPLIPIYTMPVNGTPVKGFSNGELVKSETMNDWRAHNGIDIAAAEGAEVVAVYSGEILRAEEDPLWGYVVELKVDTGYVAVYANLAANLKVKAGDRVSQGDVLGYVGSTAILENAEAPHLHFEAKSGSKYVDPVSFY